MLRWIVLAFMFYWLWKLWQRAGRLHQQRPKKTQSFQKPGEMIACTKCGVYVLKEGALRKGEQFFCSDTCRRES